MQVVAWLEEEAEAYALLKNGPDKINLPPAFSINDMTQSEGHSISHEFWMVTRTELIQEFLIYRATPT